jgi:hypothetical protein
MLLTRKDEELYNPTEISEQILRTLYEYQWIHSNVSAELFAERSV